MNRGGSVLVLVIALCGILAITISGSFSLVHQARAIGERARLHRAVDNAHDDALATVMHQMRSGVDSHQGHWRGHVWQVQIERTGDERLLITTTVSDAPTARRRRQTVMEPAGEGWRPVDSRILPAP